MTEACSEIVRDSVLIPKGKVHVIIFFVVVETQVINSNTNFKNSIF